MAVIVLGAAALLGLVLGDLGHLEPRGLLFGALVSLVGACLAGRHGTWRWLALVACALAAGGLRAATIEPRAPSLLEPYAGQVLRVTGRLVEPPTPSSSGATVRLALEVEAIAPGGNRSPPAPASSASSDRSPSPLSSGESGDRSPPALTLGTTSDLSPPTPGAGSELSPLALTPGTGSDRSPRPAPSLNAGSDRSPTAPATVESGDRMPPATALSAGSDLWPPAPAIGESGDRMPLATPLSASSDRSPPPLTPSAASAALSPASSPPSVALNVIGDPAVFGPLAAGDDVVLEGRLLAADSSGRGPPTLLLPRLIEQRATQAPSPTAWLANLRHDAAAGIHRYLPEPQASLATGVLLGGSGQLDAQFRLQLQRSGLAHLVAIDGYKQIVVAAALGGLTVRVLGARLATLPILLGIAAYTLLTGAHPSAVRAALMVGLASVAAATGRVADPLTSLILAAVAMAVLQPRILLDVGLQLSLSAVLGIVLLWPRLRRRLRGMPGFVAEPAGLTLAVTLATLPVTLSVFQSVSLVSPVAHILAVPLLPAALVSTALLAAVSSVEPLAGAAAWLAWLPNTLLVEVIRLCGNLPGAALSTGRLPTLAALGLAAGLLAWGLWGLPEAAGLRARVARLRLNEQPLALPAASVCCCLAATALLLAIRPDGRLHVHSLNAGRGQAVFIRGPTGQTALLVVGRADAAMLASQVADRLAVWEHKLDHVIQLDSAADSSLALTLARYTADEQVHADGDRRLDLGGGAALDIYVVDVVASRNDAAVLNPLSQAVPARVEGQATQRTYASVSFGNIALPLLAPAATAGPTEFVSDGFDLWLNVQNEARD